jgi:hypothetical protein
MIRFEVISCPHPQLGPEPKRAGACTSLLPYSGHSEALAPTSSADLRTDSIKLKMRDSQNLRSPRKLAGRQDTTERE